MAERNGARRPKQQKQFAFRQSVAYVSWISSPPTTRLSQILRSLFQYEITAAAAATKSSRCKRYLIVLFCCCRCEEQTDSILLITCTLTCTKLSHFASAWLQSFVVLFHSYFTVVRVLPEWARYRYVHRLIYIFIAVVLSCNSHAHLHLHLFLLTDGEARKKDCDVITFNFVFYHTISRYISICILIGVLMRDRYKYRQS